MIRQNPRNQEDLGRQIAGAHNDLTKKHNALVAQVRELDRRVGVLHDRSEIEVQKSLVSHMHSQGSHQGRLIIGVGFVALIAAWRALRPELGDVMFRWVGLVTLVSVVAFVLHEVVKIMVTTVHVRRVMKVIAAEDAMLLPSDFRTLLGGADDILFKTWAVMIWIILIPGLSAAGLLVFGLSRSIILS